MRVDEGMKGGSDWFVAAVYSTHKWFMKKQHHLRANTLRGWVFLQGLFSNLLNGNSFTKETILLTIKYWRNLFCTLNCEWFNNTFPVGPNSKLKRFQLFGFYPRINYIYHIIIDTICPYIPIFEFEKNIFTL